MHMWNSLIKNDVVRWKALKREFLATPLWEGPYNAMPGNVSHLVAAQCRGAVLEAPTRKLSQEEGKSICRIRQPLHSRTCALRSRLPLV
jgi:hypothetical protein